MNKTTKASIATAAGVLLLLGGGGTFATWNGSTQAGADATISAGNLEVLPGEEGGTWSFNGTDLLDEENIADYLVSPGDVLTYTTTMTVIAKGDSLRGQIGLTNASIAPAVEDDDEDEALAEYLKATTQLSAEGIGELEHDQTFTGVAGPDGIEQVIKVTATITFPFDDTDTDLDNGDHNAAKNGSVDLSDFAVTLTQLPAEAE
ncbi:MULTISPECIES: alternate-type signal peptide domain-containing protein [unclassified Microbacterium]|uniref:alternate-type signal peptide domain-containing protein n=1 Tax=unclassified Microbacterium TaxID=2609290 RepID=UPI00214B8979|nr:MULTISPECIES: alternate-type signal peptide domain-containing protein [unclassified Microbacterium]MCR2783155.1 alternate-type signal peptide domain-containing protein [Microbacterium sp. zg.B96]WIM15965.1 alternate-type signal peptide domain-containing protein [Microbacterium sp. zg-B96]